MRSNKFCHSFNFRQSSPTRNVQDPNFSLWWDNVPMSYWALSYEYRQPFGIREIISQTCFDSDSPGSVNSWSHCITMLNQLFLVAFGVEFRISVWAWATGTCTCVALDGREGNVEVHSFAAVIEQFHYRKTIPMQCFNIDSSGNLNADARMGGIHWYDPAHLFISRVTLFHVIAGRHCVPLVQGSWF